MLDVLPVERVMKLFDLISKRKNSDNKQRYVLSAFTAWQNGNSEHKTFKDYLIALNLYDDDNPKNKYKSPEESLKIAEDILKGFA